MKAEYAALIGLVRQHLDGTPATLPTHVDIALVAKQAAKHKLEPMVFAALEGQDLPEDIADRLFGEYHNAIFRDAQFDYVRTLVSQALEQHGIEHVFMRGMELKADYPVPALRTMSDMDILVKSEDLPKLRKILPPLGASSCYGDGNHRSFLFPNRIQVEFHPMLLHCSAPVGTAINPGWQYVPRDQQSFCREMTEEGFYLNIMCHFANHFFGAGAGIRYVLDIWVCRHLRSTKPDRAFIEKELQRVGLLKFAQNIEQLADIWFSGEPMRPELEELSDYICTSGLHGLTSRAHLNALCFSPGKNRFSALWRRAFYPKGDLENRFDWANGKPWLRPVAWIVRAWLAITRRFTQIRRWHSGSGQYSPEQIRQQQEKLARFGVTKENG